jgi:hypothetical protein
MASVNFNSLKHEYSDATGTIFPSVTTLMAFGKIIDFSVVKEEIRQRSMKRGTSVHWITQLYDEGALNVRTTPKALRGYLKAWRTWRERSGFEPVLIEKPFISPHGYAGTPDRFGPFPDGSWAVVDLKTGEGDIAAHVGVQLAPYAKWYAITEGRFNIRRIGVKLHSDGTYRAKEFPVNRMPIDFCKFYECLVAWNKEKHGN